MGVFMTLTLQLFYLFGTSRALVWGTRGFSSLDEPSFNEMLHLAELGGSQGVILSWMSPTWFCPIGVPLICCVKERELEAFVGSWFSNSLNDMRLDVASFICFC